MKTSRIIQYTILGLVLTFFMYSCSSMEDTDTKVDGKNVVYNKSGTQLWRENCLRCHSMPSPSAYNDEDWDTIGLHMKIRANLTSVESKKIFEFLKLAN